MNKEHFKDRTSVSLTLKKKIKKITGLDNIQVLVSIIYPKNIQTQFGVNLVT